MTEQNDQIDSQHDGAHRGRRISWAELYRQRPDLKPSNDNKDSADAA